MADKTLIIDASGKTPPREDLRRAAKLLAEGAIVGFHTETVYGIGVNADMPESVKAMFEAKNRPEDRLFTTHLADPSDLAKFAAEIPLQAKRIVARFWPGPVAIVIPDGKGGWDGFRCPDSAPTRELIRLSKVRVAGTSANLSGQPEALSAREVAETFPGKVAAVVDGGPCRVGKASTVAKIGPNGVEILREGAVLGTKVIEASICRVLFVCTGNTCRSAMAEGILRKMLADKLEVGTHELERHGWSVQSAGTSAYFGMQASEKAVQTLSEMNCDISFHTASPVSAALMESASTVFALAREHKLIMEERFPDYAHKIRLLDPAGEDVADPMGGPKEEYERAAKLIKKLIELRMKTICE